MDRKKLMAGDWILYKDRFAIIKSIEHNTVDILVSMDGEDMLVTETYDNIDPIPITREFLIKNGFEVVIDGEDFTKAVRLNGTLYRWKDIPDAAKGGYIIKFVFFYEGCFNKTQCMLWNNRDNMSNEGHINDMLYVHELQHAISLFGIEKEVVPCRCSVPDMIVGIIMDTFKGNIGANYDNLVKHATLGAEWRLSHPKESYRAVYDETDSRYPYNPEVGRTYSEAIHASAFQYGAEVAYNMMRRKEKTK